jgi:protein SCO1/2
MLNKLITIALFLSLVWGAQMAHSLENPEANLSDTGVVSKLGAEIDPAIELQDSTGLTVTVGQLLSSGKPTVLVPVYYDCPRLCGLVLSGVVDLLNKMSLKIGTEYNVLSVSMDAEEKPPLAAKRLKEYQKKLTANEVSADSWRFLVGNEAQVSKLMQTIGFGFKKDGEEFAHSAALYILTPEGKVSQYFTGIEFSAWDVKLALIEASQGGIGSAMDHVLLYCFRFDPSKGKYTLAAVNVMKIGGVLTLVAMGALFYYARRRSPQGV